MAGWGMWAFLLNRREAGLHADIDFASFWMIPGVGWLALVSHQLLGDTFVGGCDVLVGHLLLPHRGRYGDSPCCPAREGASQYFPTRPTLAGLYMIPSAWSLWADARIVELAATAQAKHYPC